MSKAVEFKDLLTIEEPKQEFKVDVKDRTLHVPEDTELQGLGRGLGAMLGGGTFMAFTAYLASLFMLPYIKESITLFSGLLIAVGSYVIVALGALAGYKVVEWVEKHD